MEAYANRGKFFCALQDYHVVPLLSEANASTETCNAGADDDDFEWHPMSISCL